ncbi:hypothetical protein O181_005581 [Austropuccinia psidii MF-1]|uniref:Integrase catalytic domain-containing protein n=1 Tax=Austropuccinia psidii MF-1 TaxID=1389203 RepID=A0A9Q3GG09_9BASI|nr:hypothetical protein [Austropuccinia psidii MF-1]
MDWNAALVCLSIQYLKNFFLHNNPSQSIPFSLINKFPVCKSFNIKDTPHNHPISSAKSPFKELHLNVLETTPLEKNSIQYIPVIIDHHSKLIRVYLLTQNLQSESKLTSYINEIRNKTQNWPAYLDINYGGELYSDKFQSEAGAMSIVFELGPSNIPKTNGIEGHFNQALLSKCRCIRFQSNVPIRLWDGEVRFSSTLINLLPSHILN